MGGHDIKFIFSLTLVYKTLGTPHNYQPAGFKSSPTTYHFKKMTFISKLSAGNFNTKFER